MVFASILPWMFTSIFINIFSHNVQPGNASLCVAVQCCRKVRQLHTKRKHEGIGQWTDQRRTHSRRLLRNAFLDNSRLCGVLLADLDVWILPHHAFCQAQHYMRPGTVVSQRGSRPSVPMLSGKGCGCSGACQARRPYSQSYSTQVPSLHARDARTCAVHDAYMGVCRGRCEPAGPTTVTAAAAGRLVSMGPLPKDQSHRVARRGIRLLSSATPQQLATGAVVRTSVAEIRWGSFVSRLPVLELAAKEAVSSILASIGTDSQPELAIVFVTSAMGAEFDMVVPVLRQLVPSLKNIIGCTVCLNAAESMSSTAIPQAPAEPGRVYGIHHLFPIQFLQLTTVGGSSLHPLTHEWSCMHACMTQHQCQREGGR